jgi:transposase-like protein
MNDIMITLINGQQVTADEFYTWSAYKQYWNLVPKSDAVREASSRARRGKPGGMRGRRHSDETRELMSDAHRGQPKSEQHRQALSDAKRGKPLLHKRKFVMTPQGLFFGVGEAAQAYGTNPNQLRRWIVKKPTEFYYVEKPL